MSSQRVTVEPVLSEIDFHRVEELFQAAADLPECERAAFLDGECSGDQDLRAHVQRLLRRLDDDPSLTSPVTNRDAQVRPLPAVAITEGPGSKIDRYKLLQVIGDGGFGVVYMAEQYEPVVRKVALKIIKLGMDTREVVARFEAERQALAMMDHPNIAKVLDGGATRSGRPYFVMELVRGLSITEYCDKNKLSARERLDLFLRVCEAVQHAHQKGVIHRDLKPSNVLVPLHDGSPMPKVIDFGIAKAMHTRLTEKTLFTRFEQFVGTPAYMSPEQAEMSALDVDTRTDIYSLGVLLYELLTGSTPFDTTTLKRAGLLEIQRIIREEQPPRPSLRISTADDRVAARHRGLDVAGLCRTLRGDLDWIVMKALEKDRGRRYASADQFAEDIRRHLANEPVTAGPPRARYRFWKFLVRNRAAVLSVSLVALALVAGIIGTTTALVQSTRNARMASAEADRAMTAVDFLLSTLSLTNPATALNPEVTVLTLLEHTSARVAEVFSDDPGTEARIRTTIGRAYANLGQQELAEAHLRRVTEIVDQFGLQDGQLHPALRAAGFSDLEFYNALWTLTNVCFGLERSDSFTVARRARRVGLGIIAESDPRLADLLGRFIKSIEAGAWSHAPDAMDGVPDLFAKSTAEADKVLSARDPRWPIVADTMLEAGYTVWFTPHEPLAMDFWGKALEIQRRVLSSDHPVTANTVGLLVGLLNKAGRLEECEILIRESLDALLEVFPADSFAVARAESMLGSTLASQGRFEEAEPILLRGHENMLRALKNETNWMLLESALRIVELYHAWGRPERAVHYRDTLAQAAASSPYVLQWAFSRGAFGPEHGALVAAGDRLKELCGGVSYMAAPGKRKASEILPAARQYVAMLRALIDKQDTRAAVAARLLMGWANALDPDTHREARRLMAQAAWDILQAWQERIPLDAAEAAAVLAECAQSEGARDDARRYAAQAWAIIAESRPAGDWFLASQSARIARSLSQQDMLEPAKELLESSYKMLRTQLGDGHPDTRVVRALLDEVYVRAGNPEKASHLGDDPPTN